jgi:hypothetical protein
MRCRPGFAALVLAAALAGQDHDHARFDTDRDRPRVLPLPVEDDAFHFAIFGDRTGGPRSGIAVLEQAVRDTNLLNPDLVMTVGDLVEGYNETPRWIEEMREFRAIMGRLEMPWFPVAGNHDVYYRGKDRTPLEHEGDYEQHFGPLWYAFAHKRCTFLVLYSDEANPETGVRDFKVHANHRMSRAQLDWLRGAQARAKDSRHVFVFLHHPRWVKDRYGEAWDEVHAVLAAAGNVTAVFAGHIHRMRFDGERDGIAYYALATTGGSLAAAVPAAGFLHHFNVVTVRPQGIRVATVPVGAVIDPARISGEVSDDVGKLAEKLAPRQRGALTLAADGSLQTACLVEIDNPCGRAIEVTVTAECPDRRWRCVPDHRHAVIPAKERRVLPIEIARDAAPWDVNFALPVLRIACDYLGKSVRVSLPERELPVQVATPAFPSPTAAGSPQRALELDGASACLRLEAEQLALPGPPFTVEAWLRGRDFAGRRAVVSKAQSSAFGLFASDGRPAFLVHVGGKYASAECDTALLEADRWHHLAGVWDGAAVQLYVDGKLVANALAAGPHRDNEQPLYIGADPDSDGAPGSFFAGRIDEVRISTSARYRGERFTPQRGFAADAECALLLHLDDDRGAWVLDSARARHARKIGAARIAGE